MKKSLPKRKPQTSKRKTTRPKFRTAPVKAAELKIKKILVPVDFSENSKKTLRYAASFAKLTAASLYLLHVVEPTIYPSDFAIGQLTFPNIENDLRERAEAELGNLAKSDVLKALSVVTMVKDGIPFVESTAYAKDEEIDLIIISTHGHTGVEHILFGSTAEKIVRKAPCPVLVVRSEEHDFIDERV